MKLESCYPVICTDKVQETRDFFIHNFNFFPTFESDWYMSLRAKDQPQYELAFLDYRHPSLPENYRTKVCGMLINLEVTDVDSVYQRLRAKNLPMILDIRSEEWGQRHFIVEGPNGILIDIIQNIEPSDEFKEEYNE